MSQIAGVILAAGESSRMGFPKALLAYRGTTFLEWLAMLFDQAGLAPLLVVLGHEHERIRTAVKLPASAQVLVNEDYRLGQLSSLQTAIRHLKETERGRSAGASPPFPGLLVNPVDHPCIAAGIVKALVEVFAENRTDVLIPTFNGRRGHPVIFASRLFAELLEAPLDQGARSVVHRHPVREVPVSDEGVLADIDDREAYARWIK